MLKLPQECSTCQETQATRGTKTLFLKAVSVWINKPHVVNRRLCGSTIEHVCRCSSKNEAEAALIKSLNRLEKCNPDSAQWNNGQSFTDLSEEKSLYTIIFRELVPKSEFFPRLYEAILYDKDEASVMCIPLHQSDMENDALVCPTKELSYSIKFSEIDNDFPAWAQVNEITLQWNCECNHLESAAPKRQTSSQWLRSVLLKKLVSWSQVNDISTSATSLQLVAVDKYKDTYVRLKNTYGRELVKNWTERTDPKKFVYEDVAIATYLLLIWEEDRQKKGLTKKQSFVDLGCGNGLLVYILTKEGHKGLGIDLRKRKIWDTFGPTVDLREEAIKPSSEHLFPDYDWLIGNHSDELTPWIPVIAARSSPDCSFFVLPCCHHDFVGKFGDVKRGQSRYGAYVDYVREIVKHCGFEPEIDTLRIPSTKRICLIGKERTYKLEEEVAADARRQAFIDKRSMVIQQKRQGSHITSASQSQQMDIDLNSTPDNVLKKFDAHHSAVDLQVDRLSDVQGTSKIHQASSDSNTFFHKEDQDSDLYDTVFDIHLRKRMKVEHKSECNEKLTQSLKSSSVADPTSKKQEVKKWAAGFQPRVDQGVRNCQAVSEVIKLKIVNAVFDLVLNEEEEKVEMTDGKLWRKGGSVSLSEVAALFDQMTLQELKSECGGLQTLLRNHSHIFQVSGGRVKLRDFSQADPWKDCNPQKRQLNRARRGHRDMRKTTLCWFHEHHPDGCPRSSTDCLFAHGQGELREKPDWQQDPTVK